ncbi:MAG: hypothetical protein AABZ64_14240 [Nitrospinota bacterium]
MRTARALAAALLLAAPPGAAWAGVGLANGRQEGQTAHVEVIYTNDTAAVHSTVKIVCTPPGAEARRSLITFYLSNHLGGGIPPGYTATQAISFPIAEGQKPEDVSCEAFEQIFRAP